MNNNSILRDDDHTFLRASTRALLEAEPDMTVVGEAEDGRPVVKMASQHKPDIDLMDYDSDGEIKFAQPD